MRSVPHRSRLSRRISMTPGQVDRIRRLRAHSTCVCTSGGCCITFFSRAHIRRFYYFFFFLNNPPPPELYPFPPPAPLPTPPAREFQATNPAKKKEEFRNYETDARPSVREFYRLNHRHQTYDFAQGKRKEFLGLNRRQMSVRSEEHTSELQSPCNLVCRLLLE